MPLPTSHLPKTENDTLRARAEALHLHGLLTHWSEVANQPWLAPMLDWEEQQRARRSLERADVDDRDAGCWTIDF